MQNIYNSTFRDQFGTTEVFGSWDAFVVRREPDVLVGCRDSKCKGISKKHGYEFIRFIFTTIYNYVQNPMLGTICREARA